MNLYLYLYHFTNRSKRVFQKLLSSSVVLRYVFFFRSVKNINEIKEIIKRGIHFFNVGFCIVKSASRYGDKSARGRFSARERVASFEDSNAASLIVINEKSARSGRRKTRFSSRACLAACSTAATFSHPCSTIFFGFLLPKFPYRYLSPLNFYSFSPRIYIFLRNKN